MKDPKDKNLGRHPEWNNLPKRLDNYKRMQKEVAKKNGVSKELEAARTLTEARKIVYGPKIRKT